MRYLIFITIFFSLGCNSKIDKEKTSEITKEITSEPFDFYALSSNNYQNILREAQEKNKSVLLYFTSFNCISCRQIEDFVLNHKVVREKINNEFVLLPLFTDDKRKLPDNELNIAHPLIKTIGQKNRNLQLKKFQGEKQPAFYIINKKEEILSKENMIYSHSDFYDFLENYTKKETESQKSIKNNKSRKSKSKTNKETFIPTDFKIDFEKSGFINKDSIEDLIIVLINKKDSIAPRITKILLGDNKASYTLHSTSKTAIPSKYDKNGYQKYYLEKVNISEKKINIELYNNSFYGNLFSTYQYIEEELILSKIETYNIGAGEQAMLELDILNSNLTLTTINTGNENFPSKTISKTYRVPKVLFKHSDPDKIIGTATNFIVE